MGSATALFLARRGVPVVLYDAAAAPFTGASRWNEGKIHLGFLYSADPTFRSAHKVLSGGLEFRPLVEELLGCEVEHVSREDDTYLVHPESVVSVANTRAYFEALAGQIRSHPAAREYLVDVSDAAVRMLSEEELAQIAETDAVVAGFSVPERSISTQWVADRFVDALAAEPRIELRTDTRVLGAKAEAGMDGPFLVKTDAGEDGGYDEVVNALWENRPGIDATLGIHQKYEWSHRFRVSLFVKTKRPVETPSAVLCTGPFGDVKNYNNREFYLSWYPDGLLASGESIDPPTIPHLVASDKESLIESIFLHLRHFLPSVREIQAHAEEIRLEGGWVFASGRGELSDPRSTLHQRDRLGIQRTGSWWSVDTGKYSVAPSLALQVASMICEKG